MMAPVMAPEATPLVALAAILLLLLAGAGAYLLLSAGPRRAAAVLPEGQIEREFNAERALRDVQYQIELGPRLPGTPAHAAAVDWMVAELKAAGWAVEVQETRWMNQPVRNVIGKWGQGKPWLVLGAHYDSRQVADQDPDPSRRGEAVPGANDGASGVAVLLEVARLLPQLSAASSGRYAQVWIVFFDAEDSGGLPGWDWIMGSQAFVASLQEHPDAAVIVDMIGDAQLDIFYEFNSHRQLREEIWRAAQELGYSPPFIALPKYRMLDDHTPFLQAGIPAVDIIDFDYPYWHTTQDTVDKVAAQSLRIVGETLLYWLVGGSSGLSRTAP